MLHLISGRLNKYAEAIKNAPQRRTQPKPSQNRDSSNTLESIFSLLYRSKLPRGFQRIWYFCSKN